MPGSHADRDLRQALPGSTATSHWSRARVLVVDDHRTYRLLLDSLLEKLGVAHQSCSNGEQALHALAAQRFDLVISDCRMPVMDGYAMTRELRRREHAEGRPPITVLALTVSQGPEEINRCMACGMDGWLTKPIGLAQLREALCYWLAPLSSAGAMEKHTRPLTVRSHTFPSRTSLIDAFGAWDVVEPMLSSLIQEAHADLAVLTDAQVSQDAILAAQCLHRLVGSIAFLGETGLEGGAIALINAVHVSGVALNQSALDELRLHVERYLDYLAHL
ncbi:response regulator [Pseudomonas fluorescens]|uniref:Response regulator n=1 Tax=Pseudomonas fluorescens TaxID=294 RepID=A0A1T2YKJ3_PSEFL|nr:response regulator [Pseudomonas fluorescens]OPA92772.1 response regulator [Pseudomonas fluorescens]